MRKPTGPLKGTTPLPPLGGANSFARLSMLFDIVRSLNSIIDLETLLNQIVASAAEMLEARGGALLLVDEESGELQFTVTSGMAASQLRSASLPVDDRSLEGNVAFLGRPCIENGVQQRPYLFGLATRQGEYRVEAVAGVPLQVNDKVMGVLEVLDKVTGADFTGDDVKLLGALSDAAVIAIENVRLYEAEHRHAQRLAQAYEELHNTYQATLHALTGMLDTRDVATHGHSIRVVAYTLRLANEMGITDPAYLRTIEQGALLHDVGKIGVADGILRKTGPLNEEDWTEMRAHPELGYRMLKDIEFLRQSLPIVRHHHEHWDGTGYPEGLKGEQIPLEARIFSVVDAFDAITSDRPYSKARSYEQVVEILLKESGKTFDPAVVQAFLSIPEEEWQRIRDSVSPI
jgi:putative nucleotidyltransferase with HDIG domain